MTTLLAVYTSEGCIGRCDARCYEAEQPDCDCICGGRNHGKGRESAIENTRTLAQAWIEEMKQRQSLAVITTTIHEECQHETLWSAPHG